MQKAIVILVILISSKSCLAQQWTTSGINIYKNNNGFVGIGITSPTYLLDVAGGFIHSNGGILNDATAPGKIGGWFRGSAGGSGNIVLQASNGSGSAFWFSGSTSLLKIGGNGASEPSQGVINILQNGNVGIGTTNPGSNKLSVEGTIGARIIKVLTTNPWPDFVFARNYPLTSILDLETYIKNNEHLPNIPSESDVKKDGVDLGQMTSNLLQKIEELTLYVIELKKENQEIKVRLEKLTNIK